MVVAEPEDNFGAGIGLQRIPGFQLVSGRKGKSSHFPEIQHNESYYSPHEKKDAVQAEEFPTVNVHDCSLPWVFVLAIPDRELPADGHIVFDPSSSGVKTLVSQHRIILLCREVTPIIEALTGNSFSLSIMVVAELRDIHNSLSQSILPL
jgi:hypothetical protein